MFYLSSDRRGGCREREREGEMETEGENTSITVYYDGLLVTIDVNLLLCLTYN